MSSSASYLSIIKNDVKINDSPFNVPAIPVFLARNPMEGIHYNTHATLYST